MPSINESETQKEPYCFFIIETMIFVCYIFSFVLFNIVNTEIFGWYCLLIVQKIATVSVIYTTIPRIREIMSFILLTCFVFLLVSLLFIVISLRRLQKTDQYKNAEPAKKLSGETRARLDKLKPLIIADVCLLFICLFAFELNSPQKNGYVFPFYFERPQNGNNRFNKNQFKKLNVVPLREFSYLSRWVYTWIVGGSSLAALGISSYLIFATNFLYVDTFGSPIVSLLE
jgi:hypothetical protein